jgi:hypothetical protein
MTRIVWSVIEKGAVFANMENVFRQYPNTTRKEALRMAQTVLKSHRWVKITDQRVFNYKDRIDIAQQRALQESKKKPPEAVVAPAPILAPTPTPERKEDPVERLAALFEQMFDILAGKVAAKVADRLAGQILENAPQMVVTSRPKHDPQPIPHATGHAKPGVLVIGLLPAQAHHVSHMLADKLDLSFLTAEDAVTFPKLTRAHTILMTKFISHAVQDKYRKATDLRFCNGSTGELVSILDKIVPPVL